MTQDEIIRMAREAGLIQYVQVEKTCVSNALERFAALVAAHEREKQAEQEPVAFGCRFQDGSINDCICPEEHDRCEGDYNIPLYTAPVRTKDPCNPLQDLTDDEIISALDADMDTDEDKAWFIEIVRLGIAADREKNK